MVRESQKRETRRAMCPLGSSRWSKPEQPSFLLVHGKPVFRKTLWQYVQHPFGVLPIAEHQYRIVSETHQVAPAPQVPPDYLVKPSVEHLVQVDVAEQGRKHALNAKGNFRFERQIVAWRERPMIDLRRKG